MAGTGVTLYATTAAGNKTVIGTIDWREDTYMPSQINDNVGQIMADMRALANAIGTGWIEIGDGDGTYTATYVSATSFRFDGVNVTSYYRAGMRVRVVAPTPGTLSGTITSSVFSTHTTLVVSWDSGSLSNEAITSVSLGIGSGGGSGAAASYRNILGRNGGFEVWQRGAGGSAFMTVPPSSSAYTADGWFAVTGANQTCYVAQAAGSVAGSRWAAHVYRASGSTGVATMGLEYPLDADEIALMRSSIVTLSMPLYAGATFSPAGGIITVALVGGTGAPARFFSGSYTGLTNLLSGTAALTPTTTRHTFTSSAVVPTSITQATVLFTWVPVGTAGATDLFAIDDVQLEIGSVATPFERRPFEQELAACQRHYQKTFIYTTAPAQAAGVNTSGLAYTMGSSGAVQFAFHWRFPVSMRVAPTITTYNPAVANSAVRDVSVNVDAPISSAGNSGTDNLSLLCTAHASSVAGSVMQVHAIVDAGI